VPILFRDYETRSTLDLKRVGAWKYAAHADTDVWCCAYAIDDGPPNIWTPSNPVPEEIHAAARDPHWLIVAHNDAFERAVEELVLAPRYGWPLTPIEHHRCTMAMALAAGLPAGLEGAAVALGLPFQKDRAGQRLMRKLALRGAKDPTPEELERLYAYCRSDIEVERELYRRLPPLSDTEQALWTLDATINRRGFHTDGALLDAAHKIVTAAEAQLQTEFRELTGLNSTNQTEKLIAWLAAQGCEVKDVQKPTLKHALRRKGLEPTARRAIELRLQLAHASAGKVEALLAWRDDDGRVRGTLKYHGAATGRWSGHGPQPQNFRRDGQDIDAKISLVMGGGAGLVSPVEAVGDIARAMICAPPGHRLLIGDFSGVESRILGWISGQQSKLEQWAKFDRTGDPDDDPYIIVGRSFGRPDNTARGFGKIGDLAFGYQGGVGAWKSFAPEDDVSDEATIKRYRNTWRAKHPRTEAFWYAVDRAAVNAVEHPGAAYQVRQLIFRLEQTFLRIVLPSGRALSYPFPRIELNRFERRCVMFKDNAGGKWVDCNFGKGSYGGLWTENIVSGIARDLLAAALMRLEAANYPIALHVHDEVVAEAPESFGSLDDFQHLITTLPDWAEGLPIAAKVREGERFCKTSPAAPVKFEHLLSRGIEVPSGYQTETAQPETEKTADDHNEIEDGPEEQPEEEPKEESAGYASGERPRGHNTASYIYRDANGTPYLRVDRTSAKQFPQYHWDGGRWLKGKPAGPKIPYRLPELIGTAPDVPVFVCEGEKDADNVAALGLIATTNSEGAGKGKWTADLNKCFAGKQTAYILEDNDEDGRCHAREVASNLQHIVDDIRIVSFPELPVKGDVSDWIADMGGTKEQLLARAKAAPRWKRAGSVLVRASDIVPRPMDWLWRGHILRGSQELLSGVPGNGKSQIHCAFVAYVTTGGAWPDGCNGAPAGNVIMLTAEDCLDQTITPRLIAAGADRDRVFILKKIRKDNKERMFLLSEDIEELEHIIAKTGDVRLITIDPITAFMGSGGRFDSHRAVDVRGQLGPLADLAERADVALSAITHPPKAASQRAIDHFIGSQAFIAAARIGHLAIEEVDDDKIPTGRSLFANVKNNVSRKMSTLAYRIIEKPLADGVTAAGIIWEEIVDISADQAVAAAAPAHKERGQQGDIMIFLFNTLMSGPVPTKLIEERATAHNFSKDQLDRTKKKIGIVAFREKGRFDGGWFWALPQHAPSKETKEQEK
jgi:DNA polymerase